MGADAAIDVAYASKRSSLKTCLPSRARAVASFQHNFGVDGISRGESAAAAGARRRCCAGDHRLSVMVKRSAAML